MIDQPIADDADGEDRITRKYSRDGEALPGKPTGPGYVSADDDEVEGHGYARWSDERLKQAIVSSENALSVLRELGLQTPAGGEASVDVEGHAYMKWSDERLKQAIASSENALTAVAQLAASTTERSGKEDPAGVEGHTV